MKNMKYKRDNSKIPLFPKFNHFVEKIVKTIPYEVTLNGDSVNSLEKITKLYKKYGVVKVWAGASDKTIFGNRVINWKFRAWHDFYHIRDQIPFTPEGEKLVCALQQMDVIRCFKDDIKTLKLFNAILDCEVNGQVEFEKTFGKFPSDQRAFTLEYLGIRKRRYSNKI